MISLTGKLRQRGRMMIKGEERLKIIVEHGSPRDQGPDDLFLETLFLDPHWEKQLPPDDRPVSVQVRPYPSGRNVAYAGIALIPAAKLEG